MQSVSDRPSDLARLYKLRDFQTVVLDDPRFCSIVQEQSLTIVSTQVIDGSALGPRRHLMEIDQGLMAFGCDPLPESDNLTFLGVASGRTQVLRLPVDIIDQLISAANVPLRRMTDAWLDRLYHALDNRPEVPESVVGLSEAGLREFAQHDAFIGKHDLMWIRVVSGTLHFLGIDTIPITRDDDCILVNERFWMSVGSETAEVEIFFPPGPADVSAVPLPTSAELRDELDLQGLKDQARTWSGRDTTILIGLDGLASIGRPARLPRLAIAIGTLHRCVQIYLMGVGQAEAAAEVERRELSNRRQAKRAYAAFQKLSAVLDPVSRVEPRDEPLLTAVSAVGQALGIPIFPTAKSEDLARLNTPIEGIARASNIRYRKVLLWPGWDRCDSGPLVASIGERPVALMPTGSTYEVLFGDSLERVRLNDKLRDELSPEAYMIYRPLPEKVAGVFDLLRFMSRGRGRDIAFVVIMGVIATLLGMIVPKATGVLVDSAIPTADRRLLYELAAVLFVAGFAQQLFTWVQLMTTIRASTISEVAAQSAVWDRILKFPATFFRRYSSGDLQSRVDAVGEISRELTGASLRPLVSGVLALLNFFLLWYFSWELAKIALWAAIIVFAFTIAVSHFIRKLSHRLHDLQGAFDGLLLQMIGGVSKLRVAGAEVRAYTHWVGKYSAQLTMRLKIQGLKDIVSVFNAILAPALSCFIFWRAAKLIIDADPTDETALTIGSFLSFNTAFILFVNGVSDVSETLVSVLDSVVKGKRIEPILEGRPEVPAGASDPGRLVGRISLENVSFRYRDTGAMVLDRVSFDINPGELVAFVGPSGSGKSTILRLLLGFERPLSGRVLYDRQDLAGIDLYSVRRQIGTVLQNGRLNAGSIFENITNNARVTHAEVWDAVADAGLSDDIANMPMGLHTMVAEGGSNFSGGQRQRLLIARALVVRPRMVFFDEATSALDNATQAAVSRALERRQVTRVVIAHRLSTIRHADRIYVLQGGRIVESGSFDQLSKAEGIFADLMARQMA